jgi:hypothetical protein
MGESFGTQIQEKVQRGERPPLKDEHARFNTLITRCWNQVIVLFEMK